MAARNRRLVVVCAAVTADGKLLEDAALPETLLHGGAGFARHPWAMRFERAAAVLLDGTLAGRWRGLAAGRRLLIASEDTLDLEMAQRWVERTAGEVWCFGGAGLFRALFERAAVGEVLLAVRPMVAGRLDAPTLSGPGGAGFLPASVACRLVKMAVGADGGCLLRYRVVGG